MATLDPHSYADSEQPSTRRMELVLDLDFDAQRITGVVTLNLDRAASGWLDLDTRGLGIQSVADGAGNSQPFTVEAEESWKGSRLRIQTHADRITIRYTTAPSASALQWLAPAQTAGQRHPYVFTQCQAIHARSVMPCQDTPRVRATYTARIELPAGLTAVMAAAQRGTAPAPSGRSAFLFEMPQPIPSYLFAFAAGDIAKKELGPRSAVYAEPATLEAAAWEFAEVDATLVTAEKLFGPYPWERFDLLLMPPSFPYGGMENPRLTFLTPSLLAGDRSLVNVVGHELAHSWTGNLITNSSMNDFWLNEGFTVYAERRILEALEGEENLKLHAALGRAGLMKDMARLEKVDPKLTKLRNDLTGVDPDEVYSLVPYEKGYLFLLRLEQAVGRPRFDSFLKRYIDHFRFQSIDTEAFLQFLDAELPEAQRAVDIPTWIDQPGLPSDAPAVRSSRLERVEALAAGLRDGKRPEEAALGALDSNEWQVLLTRLQPRIAPADCAWLDQRFALSQKKNLEIRVGFLTLAAASGHAACFPAVREALLATGRMKYLRPLYSALKEAGPEGQAFASRVFAEAKAGYHPVAQAVIAAVVGAAS